MLRTFNVFPGDINERRAARTNPSFIHDALATADPAVGFIHARDSKPIRVGAQIQRDELALRRQTNGQIDVPITYIVEPKSAQIVPIHPKTRFRKTRPVNRLR